MTLPSQAAARHIDSQSVTHDVWEDDLLRRYPDPEAPGTASSAADEGFRNYSSDTREGVREFYRLNHSHQTVDFVRAMRAKYLPLRHRRMSVWEAMDCLNTLVDDSDPDTEAAQTEHAVQTAEAIRA